MKWLLLVLACVAGGLIGVLIPTEWKYTFGYLMGTIGMLIVTIIN